MSKEMREQIDRFKNLFINEDFNANQSDIGILYKNHPELSKIGTPEQYSNYISTIFPNSVVKDIFYHRSPENFDNFDKSKIKQTNANRFYFSPFDTRRYGKNLKLVVLNIQNLAKPFDNNFINDVKKRHPEYIEGKSQFFHLPSQIYVNANKYGYDGVLAYEGTNDDEYSVYEPEQIHILGSKQDIEGFKKFVGFKN
jgi:hypothetical protein